MGNASHSKSATLKSFIILLFASLATWTVYGQKKVEPLTVYAYYRESTPGIIRGNIGKENNEESNKGTQKIRSWIFYAEYPKSSRIKVTGLTIENKTYPCKTELIAANQVLFHYPGLSNAVETDTLVPPTKNSIIRLIPMETITADPFPPLPVVRIRYLYKGKNRTTAEIPIRQLRPLLLQ
jgi:hypothetical protein